MPSAGIEPASLPSEGSILSIKLQEQIAIFYLIVPKDSNLFRF